LAPVRLRKFRVASRDRIGDAGAAIGGSADAASWGETAMTFLAGGRAAGLLLAMQVTLASAGGAADAKRETGDASPPPARTVKERLGSKASDDQRVDNCKVPLDLRGTRPRPDDCPDEARTVPQR
jgi:hypothetical protein